MSVTAVVLGHQDEAAVRDMLRQLRAQTQPPDEIIVCVCCMPTTRLDGDIVLTDRHVDDWGQRFCDYGLRLASSDYVFFASSDDVYEPDFIEKMHAEAGVDLIYCDFHCRIAGPNRSAEPRCNFITRGCFLVRAEFGRKVGYHHRVYDGDGRFIDDLMAAGAIACHVPEVLHDHR